MRRGAAGWRGAVVVLMFALTTVALAGGPPKKSVTLNVFFPGVGANGQISSDPNLGKTIKVHCKINPADETYTASASGTVKNLSGEDRSFSNIPLFFPGFANVLVDTYDVKSNGKFTATASGQVLVTGTAVPK